MDSPSTCTLSSLPLLLIAAPAVIWPAPENCEKVSEAVATTSDPALFVHTHPDSALVVPCSTKQKAPATPAPEA